MIAALLAVHAMDPGYTRAMLRDRGDGTVEVSIPPSPSPGQIRTVLTRQMPVTATGRWCAGTESGSGPGWVGLVEKALAHEVAGSYPMLARGIGGSGLRILTGARVRLHLRLPSAAQIRAWRDQRIVMVASTHLAAPLVRTAHGPLPPHHVFAVVGADPDTGHVHLRNPWRPDDVLVIDRRTFRRGFLSLERTRTALPERPVGSE